MVFRAFGLILVRDARGVVSSADLFFVGQIAESSRSRRGVVAESSRSNLFFDRQNGGVVAESSRSRDMIAYF